MKDSKPSQTAVWIAKGLMYLNQTGRLPEEVHQSSVAMWQLVLQHLDPHWLRLLNNLCYRYWFGLLERLTIPGLFVHYATRKKIIDSWVVPNPALECQPPKTQGEWICLARARYD